jgi:hypothetical protein
MYSYGYIYISVHKYIKTFVCTYKYLLHINICMHMSICLHCYYKFIHYIYACIHMIMYIYRLYIQIYI